MNFLWISDANDNCPNHALISATDFSKFEIVKLYALSSTSSPNWIILNKVLTKEILAFFHCQYFLLSIQGAEIMQTINSHPGVAVGSDVLAGVDFEGTFYVGYSGDDDYVGFVFSYQVCFAF